MRRPKKNADEEIRHRVLDRLRREALEVNAQLRSEQAKPGALPAPPRPVPPSRIEVVCDVADYSCITLAFPPTPPAPDGKQSYRKF